MEPQTTERVVERAAGPAGFELDARFGGKYLSLTSFKRDGTAVPTPVWFVVENDRLLVKTGERSFKAKRIRRNPAVMIAPCSASGRSHGDPVPAQAELLPKSEMDHVDQLMAGKYRVDRVLILPLYRAVQWLRGVHAGTAEVAIAIAPTAPAASSPKPSDTSGK
ncbi:MAG: PPOX class F420-dependent oxidoreductase [Solirubrobacteraceae bacterium]